MNRKELVVSTNADSGLGSLRAALEQTQRKPGSYDIVFQSNARADNNLGTGYFTIALESALPNIYRSDIKINTDAPRSVTILPRETLENPGISRDNGPVIAGQDRGDGRQAAWLLGLRADDGQKADQKGEVSL
jgi:hypothetical protein